MVVRQLIRSAPAHGGDDTVPAVIDLPVADPWFVRGEVGDGITLVTEPHVHPLLRCNVWHVQGRVADLVVDTAMGLAPLRHLVERASSKTISSRRQRTFTAITWAGCTSSRRVPSTGQRPTSWARPG